MKQAIVKLNEGVSGEGNATVDLSDLDELDDSAIFDRVRAMRFELGKVSFDDYAAKFRARGGIVEERVGVGAKEVRSPSVQLRITPLGKVELLSTHDQMLGGPSGQRISVVSFQPIQLTPPRLPVTPPRLEIFCETPVSSVVSRSIS